MPGLLVLMGSGETSPTMVEVHRSAARTLGRHPRAVLLDTPYAFQENAADITARARAYFARSVGLDVIAGDDVAGADWVFSGPGSPTYALDRWSAGPIGADLRARVAARRGVTVLASAAACTAGVAAVPVYEIYKVGADPHWREGLDLLGPLGLRVVVIPHYDNAEGGTHDTRYCYLGERRLTAMEAELPGDVAILGVDEHTAVTVDLDDGRVTVSGRGALTVRRHGAQTRFPAGTVTDLPGLTRGGGPATRAPAPAGAQVTLAELMAACAGRFEAALSAYDGPAAASAVLDLEAEIVTWAADTEADEGGVDQARDALRLMIARLGASAGRAERVVAAVVALRSELRAKGGYAAADELRRALAAAGVSVHDTGEGPRWAF
ncbi:hypothetical protein [Herbidospora daliensis]|uniref:hypothetical protein n=1 Tax=Herbidospora daliensis TaxID=295585 RepID=UPI000783183D|nr:hypothetical protein [Herbidospora daliensis]